MPDFIYSVELPFSKKTVAFKEIPTKDQLFLVKSMMAFPAGLEGDLQFINTFAELLQRNVSEIDIKGLTIIEVLLLALKIRSISFGSICKLQAIKEEKQTIIELDCDQFLKNLFLGLNELSESNWKVSYKTNNVDITLCLDWPTWQQLPQLLHILHNTDRKELPVNVLPLFIREININDNGNNILTYPRGSNVDINRLPAHILQNLLRLVNTNVEALKRIDLFQLKNFNGWQLDMYSPNLLEVYKLPFLFDLADIHHEIFTLSSQLDTNYILNLSSQERRMYLNFFPKKTNNSPEKV